MPFNYQEQNPVVSTIPAENAAGPAKKSLQPAASPPQPVKTTQHNASTGSSAAVKNICTASNATRNAYTQHSTVASRVPAQVRSGKSNFGAAGPSVSNLNIRMAQTNVSNPYNSCAAPYNPSQGPTASQITTPWRTAKTNRSKASFPSARRGINTAVCKLSGYTKKDFHKGEVISLPFHCANTNPHVDPNTDDRWRSTVEGPVYSKRRMMAILFIYEQDHLRARYALFAPLHLE
ncbi:hypothetical protein D0864_11047 [Hortaea werneckii]|uniref:Uncharacterized protein n=1 Tax=Hortaea werneckii TaxID=91943 RepID=A0A3M7DZH9_HORWE|nr:hypothetical protein D0864_11047 [Hortaea werneckii]